MGKKLYWLKLKKDFFKDREVKKLKRIAGGDTYTVIYLKLLLLSLDNGGIIFYEGIEDNFEDEMSLEIDETYENIKFTVKYLMTRGLMVKLSNDEYEMTEAKNMTISESESASRVRRFRENARTKALQCNGKALQRNTDVTLCNTDIDKDIEKDIEKDKNTIVLSDVQVIDFDAYMNFWNHYANQLGLAKIKAVTESRKKKIKARLKIDKDFAKNFAEATKTVETSDFLKGVNSNWKISFDWLIENDKNYMKVLEGNYNGSKLNNQQQQNDAISARIQELYSKYGN